jgi:peptidoglycan hydrolase CwlO-like protein
MKSPSFIKNNQRYRGPIESKKINNKAKNIGQEFKMLFNECEKIRNKIKTVSKENKESNNKMSEELSIVKEKINMKRNELYYE